VSTTLVVDSVGRRYGRRSAVVDVSFEWDAGALGVAGSNGSGKSTLLGMCAGVIAPSSGSVTLIVDGVAMSPRAGRVGYVPQQFGFPRSLRIADMVAYSAWLQGVDNPSDAASVALQAVDLQDDALLALGKASGGMVRRAGIAAALVSRPDVLVLDEPSAGVDVEQREVLRSLIRAQATERLVLLSSHIGDDFTGVCRELMILDHGRPVFTGTPSAAIELAGGQSMEKAIVEIPKRARDRA
jgi:ABC-2 type transport system ATP-binding protein